MLSPAGTFYNLECVKLRLQALPRSGKGTGFFSKRGGTNHYKGEDGRVESRVVDFLIEVGETVTIPASLRKGGLVVV